MIKTAAFEDKKLEFNTKESAECFSYRTAVNVYVLGTNLSRMIQEDCCYRLSGHWGTASTRCCAPGRKPTQTVGLSCVDFPDLFSSCREELLLALHNFATSLLEWAEDEGPG